MTKFEFQPFDKALVRMDNVSVWTPAFFGRLDTDDKHTWRKHITTASVGWAQCIPYNESTKHLCGTSDPYIDPAEAPAFEFGDIVEGVDESGDLLKGIFSYAQSNDYWGEVLVKGEGSTRTFYMRTARLIRKGNFND